MAEKDSLHWMNHYDFSPEEKGTISDCRSYAAERDPKERETQLMLLVAKMADMLQEAWLKSLVPVTGGCSYCD